MSTFLGCDPVQMEQMADRFTAAATRMRMQAEDFTQRALTVPWNGADAEAHCADSLRTWSEVTGFAESLEETARKLIAQAAEQEEASRPDHVFTRDVLTALATSPAGQIADLIGNLRPAQPFPLPSEPTPMKHPDLWETSEEAKEIASFIREKVMSKIPGGGLVNFLFRAHDVHGDILDSAENTLNDAGFEHAGAFLAPVRFSYALQDGLLGEDSAARQYVNIVERGILSDVQTVADAGAAICHGDIGGAVSAVDRGVYRKIDNFAELATVNPGEPLFGFASDVADIGADVTRPFNPDVAETLDQVSDGLDEKREDIREFRDTVTDLQSVYEFRREKAPMPWDEEPA